MLFCDERLYTCNGSQRLYNFTDATINVFCGSLSAGYQIIIEVNTFCVRGRIPSRVWDTDRAGDIYRRSTTPTSIMKTLNDLLTYGGMQTLIQRDDAPRITDSNLCMVQEHPTHVAIVCLCVHVGGPSSLIATVYQHIRRITELPLK